MSYSGKLEGQLNIRKLAVRAHALLSGISVTIMKLASLGGVGWDLQQHNLMPLEARFEKYSLLREEYARMKLSESTLTISTNTVVKNWHFRTRSFGIAL